MKFFVPFLFLLLSAPLAKGQLQMQKTELDFGLLRRADAHWMDVEIINTGSNVEYIFRVDAPKNTDIKFSSKEIAPGDNAFIRIAYSPAKEGKFKEELLVHASAWDSPEKLELVGESTHALSTILPCPNFGSEQSTSSSAFHVSVQSIKDNSSIVDADVVFYKNGQKITSSKTDSYGELTSELPYGRYLITVRREGSEIDTAMYVNAVNNHLVVLLDASIEIGPTEELVTARNTPEPVKQPFSEPVDKKPKNDEEIATRLDSIDVDKVEYNDLPLKEYKPNNLVFLVDISASMKQRGKLELMKIAIIELLEVLRPMDRFTLISYASDTEVLMQTASNYDREACIEAIQKLSAGGETAGARAIKKAGNMALKNFVEDGNNQIVLATDGAFNEEIDKAVRYTRKNKRKEIGMSIVGVKCGPFTEKQMTILVEESNGKFIPIQLASHAGDVLVDEIKRTSRR